MLARAMLRAPARLAIAPIAPAQQLRTPINSVALAAQPKRFQSTKAVEMAIASLESEYAEAQMLIEDADEVVGTSYFPDDLREAKDAVQQVEKEFDALLETASDAEERASLEKRFSLPMRGLMDKLSALAEKL